MAVKYDEYMRDKQEFLKNHNNDFTISTSGMNEYGCYSKHYFCEDGAIWYECMSPEWEYCDVMFNGEYIGKEKIKFLRTEYFSSDNSRSKFYFEKF